MQSYIMSKILKNLISSSEQQTLLSLSFNDVRNVNKTIVLTYVCIKTLF